MTAVNDLPPNSRLYILCSASFTAEDMRSEFEKYGQIEDCWVVHGRKGHKTNGVCYVKFSKASEACTALEEMDNKAILNESRPIRVKMAAPMGVGNKRESTEELMDRLRCAFVRVPNRTTTDGEPYTKESITELFGQYGTVTGCNFIHSNKRCYVTFEKPSQAARAIEECPKEFSAVFVDPEKSSLLRKRVNRPVSPPSSFPPSCHSRRPLLESVPHMPLFPYPKISPPINHRYEAHGVDPCQSPSSHISSKSYDVANSSGFDDITKVMGASSSNPTRCQEIYIKFNYSISRETTWRLCNLVPGLENVHLIKTVGENSQLHAIYLVRYSNPLSAGWAWEKLQDLEYPPGSYIRVRYADAGFPKDWDLCSPLNTTQLPVQAYIPSSSRAPDVLAAQLGVVQDRYYGQPPAHSAVQEADMLSSFVNDLSSVSGASSSTNGYHFNGMECSVKLSYPKALLPKGTPCEAQLFYLHTKPIPDEVLEEVFSTFGDFIGVSPVPGKNYGFAMYASKRSADAAMVALNNATVGQAKVKILNAGPEPPQKRERIDY